MSGGYWDYANDDLCYDVFGYNRCPMYNIGSSEQSEIAKSARRANALEDRVITELVYDVFCLMHSYDWYKSCDTTESSYRKDVNAFKKKWLKGLTKDSDYIREIITTETESLKQSLMNDLLIEEKGQE